MNRTRATEGEQCLKCRVPLRYGALLNTMTVGCVQRIEQRLCAQNKRENIVERSNTDCQNFITTSGGTQL